MRKQKQYHFIYKTTNLLNGKYYIGMHSSDSLTDGYLGSGKRLRYSINKYGKTNHIREILEFCNTREELKSREKEIVNLNEITKLECMNLVIGGEGGGGFKSKEHQYKCQSAGGKAFYDNINKRRLNDIEFYKYHSSKTKIGMIEYYKTHNGTFTGKHHSIETKKKISESKKGNGTGSNNSQFGKCWITNEIINKKIYQGDVIPTEFRLGRKIP